ncbi:MAG: cobalamin biosynthesis protein [Hyphomicrobiales bacterium]|nr:cobalamin biosynthesis protein [Hyphomicrobiales bacterium]
MIVAGIGSRKGVSVTEVVAAVEAALREHGLEMSRLTMLATTSLKRDEAGIVVASSSMKLPLALVDAAALAQMSDLTLTRSGASMAAAGTPSVSEAAALAAAGDGARLAGPRTALGRVTCAIAFGDGT